jgi:hypothetical protein
MPPTRRLILPLLPILASVLVAGCEDEPSGPEAFIVAAEAEAALALALDLPTLPGLVARALEAGSGDPLALAEARALWVEAEAAGDPEAADALRGAAYDRAAPVLAAGLDPEELAAMFTRLERWSRAAERVIDGRAFPEVGVALAEGRSLLARARAAAASGDAVAALREALAAADRLATTTPGGVALRLIRQVEVRLDRLGDTHGEGEAVTPAADELTYARARRLLRGAREALGRGDHVLAIRRAYYARQLLSER